MKASEDLYNFIFNAIKGIVDHQDEVNIETIESGKKTVTLIIRCHPEDIKFVNSRMRALKYIAIAIAQRHRHIVNIFMNE